IQRFIASPSATPCSPIYSPLTIFPLHPPRCSPILLTMLFASINPADGARISAHRGHTPAEIDSRIDTATQAFTTWNQLTPARRSILLRRLGRTLRAQSAPLSALITSY